MIVLILLAVLIINVLIVLIIERDTIKEIMDNKDKLKEFIEETKRSNRNKWDKK